MRMVEEKIHASGAIVESKIESKSSIFSWIGFILKLIVIFIICKFVFGITIIDGHSMNPTFDNRDIILTTNLFYTVERNDIAIVKNPNGFNIIKRIIALPGETIKIQDGIVYVNGTAVEEHYTLGKSNDMPETKVDEGFYFIMGDNRAPGESLDSRSPEIGQIARSQIVGEHLISLGF